jgi:hypothetical protein
MLHVLRDIDLKGLLVRGCSALLYTCAVLVLWLLPAYPKCGFNWSEGVAVDDGNGASTGSFRGRRGGNMVFLY